MTDVAAVQNVIGSVPVVALDPPPEGTQVVNVTFTLKPLIPNIATTFQLSSPGGFALSQVVTLFIDNSVNQWPVTVVHGALNETVTVAARATVIVPTFSTKQPYPINVAVANGVFPQSNLSVQIAFMNYARAPGTFSSTSNLTIIGTGQNVVPLIATGVSLNATGVTAIGPTAGFGNWVLDSLDIALTSMIVNAFGIEAGISWLIYSKDVNGIQQPIIALGQDLLPAGKNVAPADNVFTPSFSFPFSATWPLGLNIGRNVRLYFDVSLTNVTTAFYRINVSGIATL